jgi:hypothetical protein
VAPISLVETALSHDVFHRLRDGARGLDLGAADVMDGNQKEMDEMGRQINAEMARNRQKEPP